MMHKGRSKGTPNRDKFELWQKCQDGRVDVFKILLQFASGDWEGLGFKTGEIPVLNEQGEILAFRYTITPELRLHAAKEAAKYLYPQLKALELSGQLDVNEEKEKQVEHLKALHSQGMLKIAASDPKPE